MNNYIILKPSTVWRVMRTFDPLDPALPFYVMAVERDGVIGPLIALRHQKEREEGYSIYHLARDMGSLSKKSCNALEPHFPKLASQTPLRPLVGKWRARKIDREVARLYHLENARVEWTVRELKQYAHFVGQRAHVQLFPLEGRHSLKERFDAIQARR